MFTHVEDPRMTAHFERLRREAGLPAFRVRHVGDDEGAITSADVKIGNRLLGEEFEARRKRMLDGKWTFGGGFFDLVFAAALSRRPFDSFDYVWVLEGDVDYTGPWGDFFAIYAGSETDLIGFRMLRKSEAPNWVNWKWASMPEDAPAVTGLFPTFRISRRLLEAYIAAIRSDLWRGHCEALLPTLALSKGMKIEDMSGRGEFAALQSRAPLDSGTYSFRPVRSTSYFHEQPDAFPKRNMLYHPVKI
jgi:hypothetical protein